jgi:Rrf2 family transcriptional regulator, iron-sulfur cluster assembly transcription factor
MILRLSKKLLFAIEAVVDIAYNAGDSPVPSVEIGERQGIPRRFLEPVLQQLVRDGILKSERGPRGGYRLARERRRVSVGDIVRAVRKLETAEDPIADPAGSELGRAVVRPLWLELQEEAMARLDQVTLEELCLKAYKSGVPGEYGAKVDFTI